MDILRFDGARPTWFVAHSGASSEIASLHCSHWFSNPDPDLSSCRRLRSHGESWVFMEVLKKAWAAMQKFAMPQLTLMNLANG